MNPFAINSQITLLFPLPPIQTHHKTTLTITRRAIFFKPPCFSRFNYRQNPVSKVVRSSMGKDNNVLDGKEAALLVNTCITRNLPPVLSLEQGLDIIKDAVDEIKANPPSCSSGMFRFQVAVPPSAKALNWFCSQPELSEVFPLFFVSNENENPTYKSLSLGRSRGVFGIGSAVNFRGPPPPHVSDKGSAIQRYLRAESTSSKAYGFLDIKFDTETSTIKHQSGSFYLFIPQIELDEFEDISFLHATLAWDDSSLCTFTEAVQKFELAFNQARNSCVNNSSQLIHSSLSKFNIAEEHTEMVRLNALLLDRKNLEASALKLEDPSSFCNQFSARLSPSLLIANNMHQKDDTSKLDYFTKDFPNINALWASLIVEECTRLGLTYFCIAPGSRSSPLTIAAASHPLTTCIACIDERSLAFHALGFAKGSQKPAVIITSSGTAVSNLFPAVVEASQNFVPMVVLTADRPPELIDVGANQAINQVNHFGTFVRQFFSLPPPSDEISARMVLTTVDSAVSKATSSPTGPIHINCPFKEPLAYTPRDWNRKCLNGLDFWMSNAKPFTTYIPLQNSLTCNNNTNGHMTEALELIRAANNGILVFGSIHKEDDMWAALLLAKHLLWPVIVDVQSGLRLRKYLSSILDRKDILFVDQVDQLLLSDSVRDWMKADVIIQIGSRITGRRISQMIEQCCPCPYIMVDNHPSRHDPSYIITHRIHSSISHFTEFLIKSCLPDLSNKRKEFIRGLDMTAAWEISNFINSEKSLTEPYVARKIFENIRCGSALFFGNSMTVRDADMYGSNWVQCTHNASLMISSGLPCHGVHVSGNRGASGIDGLISTAVGFAVGCNKRVLLVMGDVSFLHDTNGLALLRQRTSRKPMVILVVNNHGGAIFSQLPVANTTDRSILDQFFYTTHDVSIRHLCLAHGVKHVQVQTKTELQDALFASQRENADCVVEVESGIDTNVEFHSNLRNFTRQASDHALSILSKLSVEDSTLHYKISKMEYSLYRVKLNVPTTAASQNSNTTTSYREGFVISLFLEDGSIGFGEVAPLEIHKENLHDVEEQLRFLIHALEGNTIDNSLPLLKSSISSWIWNNLGIPPGSILPSVRCGLEMAILSAIASTHGTTLLDIIHPQKDEISKNPSPVQICALIDSYGTPTDTAFVASNLVAEGFTAIKIKVARRSEPDEDIAAIKEVRKKVGPHIVLRADANRKWTYDQAVKFAHSVKDCCLQYIEEPVNDENDIVRFCEETGLAVALDETINCMRENPLRFLEKYIHSGITAVVIKPSVIGGFENAALVARWAQQHGKTTVISAAFESALGLSAYIQFARHLDLQNYEMQKLTNKISAPNTSHGFGTYKWFNEQVTEYSLNIRHNPNHGCVEADATEAGQFLQKCRLNPDIVVRTFLAEEVKKYQLPVDSGGAHYSINVVETGESIDGTTVVFLHGFLGTGGDWMPIMKAASISARCIAVDLPGHGGSKLKNHQGIDGSDRPDLSMDVVVDIVRKVLDNLTSEKVVLVGYSMGARIALYTALKYSNKVEGAVIISGSPGLVDENSREIRKAKDEFRASTLVSNGLRFFTEAWYAEELWASLRCHPHFKQIANNRLQHDDLLTLGKILSDLSIGKQPPMWEDLKQCKVPLQLIVGEKDAKFKAIARDMQTKIGHENGIANSTPVVEIPDSGHAVHLENPLAVIAAINQFIKRGN